MGHKRSVEINDQEYSLVHDDVDDLYDTQACSIEGGRAAVIQCGVCDKSEEGISMGPVV